MGTDKQLNLDIVSEDGKEYLELIDDELIVDRELFGEGLKEVIVDKSSGKVVYILDNQEYHIHSDIRYIRVRFN